MDFGDPFSLISGLILGVVGMAMFIYGKKSARLGPIFAGVAICAIPYFIASVLLSWLLAAACMGGLYLHSRHA